jgi:hypothetical protein
MRARSVAVAAAWTFVAALSASAFGQDYAVTSVTGRYQAPPAGATQITLINNQTTPVTLPFTFPFYGSGYSSAFVCSEGFIQFGVASGTTSAVNAVFPHAAGATDGQVCPYWDDLNMSGATARCWRWTTGTTPARTFYVGWENVPLAVNANARLSFQVQLSEDTGRIVFAYKPDTSPTQWPASSYTPGIDAFNESRFATPAGMNVVTNTGRPPADFQFDPTIRAFTGRLLYEQVASDASGVGNSVFGNVPLPNVRVELRKAGGSFCGAGTTDAAGNFSVGGVALLSSDTGGLTAMAQNSACILRTVAAGPTIGAAFGGTFSFAAGQSLGTQTLTVASDPGGTFLPAFHVARVLAAAHATVSALTTKTISQLDVLYDASSPVPTTYVRPAAPSSAFLRLGGPASGNPDGWDTDVVLKAWGGHVLGSISAFPTSPYDAAYDKSTSPQNAFAEAFGYALFAALNARSTYVDATSSSTATVIDLESTGSIATPKGASVAAWVAAALHDLLDSANEPQDLVDGTIAGRTYDFFAAANSMTTAPVADAFLAAWVARGSPGAITRDFIWHGLLPDDAFELNGFPNESSVLGLVGLRRAGLVLNVADEDWFETTLDAATVSVEIRTPEGVVVGGASSPVGFGPTLAATALVPAGTYRVRVQHQTGPVIGAYALQIHAAMTIDLPPTAEWTVGRGYARSLTIAGGIPPYTLVVTPPFAPPPGLLAEGSILAVTGTPVVPGTYGWALTARDAGSPRHEGSAVQTFVENPRFELPFGKYSGVPIAKTIDSPLPRVGGTPPLSFVVTGDAPTGTTFDATRLHVVGSATAEGVWPIGVSGGEAAGSTAAASTSIVVCTPIESGAARMHLGADVVACGFWFDAVEGSAITASAATPKGAVKRALTPFVFGPDGAALSGKLSAGTGKAKAAGVICPESGRYYAVFEAGAGVATELVGAVKIVAPKKGKGSTVAAASDTLDVRVGALAGATLVFKDLPVKNSKLGVQLEALVDPTGAETPLAGLVQEKGAGFVLTAKLPISGTWIVRIHGKAGSGIGGHAWTYTLKQPKGVAYSAD